MVARVAHGVADPDPEPAELLGPELIDHRAESVVPAVAARLAEPQLPEREREVVGDDEQVAERGVLAREDFPYGEPGVVHEREWLDEGELESLVPAHRELRGVTLPPTPRPARSRRAPAGRRRVREGGGGGGGGGRGAPSPPPPPPSGPPRRPPPPQSRARSASR